MRMCRFAVQVTQPLIDSQIQQLFSTIKDACVEVGAWRGWAAVSVDRLAPSLPDALVVAIRDLESAGLVALDVGPDDDLVTAQVIAERAGCSDQAVHRWASGEGGPSGFPAPAVRPTTTGGATYYRWSEVEPWLRERLGPRATDDDVVYRAVNLILRLRTIAPAVERMTVLRSLL